MWMRFGMLELGKTGGAMGIAMRIFLSEAPEDRQMRASYNIRGRSSAG